MDDGFHNNNNGGWYPHDGEGKGMCTGPGCVIVMKEIMVRIRTHLRVAYQLWEPFYVRLVA